VKKKEYKKAYRCLEKILHDVLDDTVLLLEIVDLCLLWNKPELVKLWLIKLINIRFFWSDYMLLSRI
jgi:hypothetical protein